MSVAFSLVIVSPGACPLRMALRKQMTPKPAPFHRMILVVNPSGFRNPPKIEIALHVPAMVAATIRPAAPEDERADQVPRRWRSTKKFAQPMTKSQLEKALATQALLIIAL
jgi:hypothetical protein